jgi:deoxyribodipyrimidine photo-lyase
MHWHPTRTAALERLDQFVPHAGRAYASGRNVDRGPLDRSNVSALSPYLRRRMITEEEVVQAVLARHSPAAAEKFIQEVYWRTYWKGWLEMRPSLLWQFDTEREALKQRLDQDRGLSRRIAQAMAGETGIACFDAWVNELHSFGWLHNHSRMWFASIWIFTLGLPWQIGADFFYKHLLDADPASNTLSWRWVAGLHTQGKHYLARASNIDANTLGRFPYPTGLNERALPLTEDQPAPSPMPIPAPDRGPSGKIAILISEEDLHPESWHLNAEVTQIAALPTACVGAEGSPAMAFSVAAIDDSLRRASEHFGVAGVPLSAKQIAGWATGAGVKTIVTGYAPVGLIARDIALLRAELRNEGIDLIQHRRRWDVEAWPHARAGFFGLKKKIPNLLSTLNPQPGFKFDGAAYG